MTNEPSPRPWRAEPSGRVGTDCLFDANGTYIGTVPKIDSALIVAAVNEREWSNEEIHRLLVEKDDMFDYLFDEAVKIREERDRLRDIVRRLHQMCCEDWARTNEAGRALLREARTALGEDKQ